jgi:hypothetical protein
MQQNAAKVLAENAQYCLKPFVSTSRKTGSANVRGCCFEVARRCAALPDAGSADANGRPGLGGYIAPPFHMAAGGVLLTVNAALKS